MCHEQVFEESFCYLFNACFALELRTGCGLVEGMSINLGRFVWSLLDFFWDGLFSWAMLVSGSVHSNNCQW